MTTSSQPQHILSHIPLAVYCHIPFCRTRCTYCAFNTYTGLSDQIAPYMHALRCELALVAGSGRCPVETIYFGGGTPSLVPANEIEATLQTCDGIFSLAPDIEISLEVNPGTVDANYLRQLRQIGINRLSIGMQSAHEHELKLFARSHHTDDVRRTVKMARAAGLIT
jgi:oxygen-independent coproporphyrinogen-3 oxidase